MPYLERWRSKIDFVRKVLNLRIFFDPYIDKNDVTLSVFKHFLMSYNPMCWCSYRWNVPSFWQLSKFRWHFINKLKQHVFMASPYVRLRSNTCLTTSTTLLGVARNGLVSVLWAIFGEIRCTLSVAATVYHWSAKQICSRRRPKIDVTCHRGRRFTWECHALFSVKSKYFKVSCCTLKVYKLTRGFGDMWSHLGHFWLCR